MEKKGSGRPVDIKGIDVNEIREWIDSTKKSRKVIICQAMIALDNSVPMQQVCRVLGVTREGIRRWKEMFRNEGIGGVLRERKRGKPSRLTVQREQELKSALKEPPHASGMEGGAWNGRMIREYALVKWGVQINPRTASNWLAKCR